MVNIEKKYISKLWDIVGYAKKKMTIGLVMIYANRVLSWLT